MRRFTIVLGLLMVPVLALGDDKTRLLTGRVIDARGNPIEGVDVTTFWSANGITKAELQRRQESPENPIKGDPEGVMEPWGRSPTVTDANGCFSIVVHEDDYALMAIDAERRAGGIGTANPQDPEAPIEITLKPLIKVHGVLRVAGSSDPPAWTGAIISLPVNERFPLGRDRKAFCGSYRAQFAFRLPPGRYLLNAYNEGGETNDVPYAETVPDVVINLTEAQRDVDLGEVKLTVNPTLSELASESISRGTWGDYTQRYGQPAPEWHVHDAKGVSKDVQPRDYRGEWLAVYFWGPYCRPCLKRGLPELIEFYEQHADQRDRFEVIAYCLDKDGGMQSIGDIDRMLEPVIENVWGGKTMEFPILLDNSFATYERYGLDAVGHLILIDPQGILRKGDLSTLAAILSKPQ